MPNPSFANVSAVSGLNFADDARGLAFVDWDQDGDLDVWLRNRSAPRLRLMRNMTQEIAAKNRSVSLKLIGTNSNADAIGASAELIVRDQISGKRLVRTVRAGDAFLSQSSKQLHFGLAEDANVEKVVVRWPGGDREEFHDVAHGRFQLTQGQGKPVSLKSNSAGRLAASRLDPLTPTDAARIVLPGRVPFPPMELVRTSGETRDTPSQPTLYVFWTTSCPNCRKELDAISQHSEDFNDAELDVVSVCVDNLQDTPTDSEWDAYLDEIRFPLSRATTTSESMNLLRHFQNALFGKHPRMVVPTSLLVDAENQLVSVYRGSFSPDTFLHDRELISWDDDSLRKAAAPLPGTWITRPATRSQFAKFVGARLAERFPSVALAYYEAAAGSAMDDQERSELAKQVNRLRSAVNEE